jgi:hypothetical protein
MQSLVGAEISPEELARRIRHLRDDWRTLNRGAGEDVAPQLQQFDEAADRAYEPCREYFARQAEVRRENQAHREALLERLTTFAAEQAGDDVNWSLVRQALVESRREWQQYSPVDQAVVKALQDRFHAVHRDLQARLDAEYARNVQQKTQLIARVAELLTLEDTRQAIEETKSVQRAWKSVGPVPRNRDNALWEEFRKQCDAVFQRSSQEMAAYSAALETNQAQALALCENIERLADTTGVELLAGTQQLNELRAQFESLELPRANARQLYARFGKATTRCMDAVRRQRAAEARRGWLETFQAAARVRAFALGTVEGRSAAECEPLRLAAESSVSDLAHAPKGVRTLLENQLLKITNGTINADVAANEAALRLLCVRAELIAGVESPADDSALRREYQMQRLVGSMQRGERVSPAEIGDLALEWITVGPVPAATTTHCWPDSSVVTPAANDRLALFGVGLDEPVHELAPFEQRFHADVFVAAVDVAEVGADEDGLDAVSRDSRRIQELSVGATRLHHRHDRYARPVFPGQLLERTKDGRRQRRRR